MIYRITDVKIPMDTGDFRLLDRKVIDVMNNMRERHRFLRGMSAWVGYKLIGVPYRRAARFSGKTKYPFKKMLKLALNAITGFSYFPLQLATYFGFILAGQLLTEMVFSYPGLGFYLVRSVTTLDYPLMQALFLMITMAVLGANFLVDILYVQLDPRVRVK